MLDCLLVRIRVTFLHNARDVWDIRWGVRGVSPGVVVRTLFRMMHDASYWKTSRAIMCNLPLSASSDLFRCADIAADKTPVASYTKPKKFPGFKYKYTRMYVDSCVHRNIGAMLYTVAAYKIII